MQCKKEMKNQADVRQAEMKSEDCDATRSGKKRAGRNTDWEDWGGHQQFMPEQAEPPHILIVIRHEESCRWLSSRLILFFLYPML